MEEACPDPILRIFAIGLLQRLLGARQPAQRRGGSASVKALRCDGRSAWVPKVTPKLGPWEAIVARG